LKLDIEEEDRKVIKELRDGMRRGKIFPTDLLNYKLIFHKYAKLNYFQTKHLILISHFMGHEPVTGFNTVNRVIQMPNNFIHWLTNYRLPIIKLSHESNQIFNAISHALIIRDLKLLFARLRNEDQLIS